MLLHDLDIFGVTAGILQKIYKSPPFFVYNDCNWVVPQISLWCCRRQVAVSLLYEWRIFKDQSEMEKYREKQSTTILIQKYILKLKQKKHTFSKFYLGKHSNMNKDLENDFIFDSMG